MDNLITEWEGHGDTVHDDVTYISDVQFAEYFELVNTSEYIATIFELLDGEYGISRDVQYEENFIMPSNPLYINYDTNEMILFDDDCLITKSLNKHKLTMFCSSFFITTSEYLKAICMLLFLTHSELVGFKYVCNNLFSIAGYILPQFINQTKYIDCEIASLPFSLSFFKTLKYTYNLKNYHSQIDNRTYQIVHA
ncbi:hypothetical protein HgNV_060 [Homarus gammarus nudivirus]|uniref:Uncharacterized protein n=1 Tax=Homarus gammarus nudivirus TaxID=2509616 RepID=A0A411HB73_9VIRU|nr:hypothetical protein KM727_gp60 [Homarus gammarus nudivirus]QBB28665.1 hypothetical protein HgNV_060 [Homarus gammarus nudivirus]